jgi:ADP-ribose pyrophosphatase YjhB (NUDIX family)
VDEKLYTDAMGGFVKGTTTTRELRTIAAAVHRAVTAIKACPDPEQAFREASELGTMSKEIATTAADIRAYLAARIVEDGQLSRRQLGVMLHMSKTRADQLVKAGQEKGEPMTDPGTDPEPPVVALGIITSDLGVLIARRHDKIPPYTFPGGELRPGESPAAAVLRKVPQETGASITGTEVIGRRIHPKTGRVMVYVAASLTGSPTDIQLGDPDDLAEVVWASLEETDTLMPDMYKPVHAYLKEKLH